MKGGTVWLNRTMATAQRTAIIPTVRILSMITSNVYSSRFSLFQKKMWTRDDGKNSAKDEQARTLRTHIRYTRSKLYTHYG